MAPRVKTSGPMARGPLALDRGCFYPGEVVRILGLEGMNYAQLRRLFRLATGTSAAEDNDRGWARFTFRDLISVKAALALACPENEQGATRRRLRLQRLERICEKLRREYGIANPLAELAFTSVDGRIMVRVKGIWFDSETGQLLLSQVEDAVEQYLETQHSRLRGEKGRLLRQKVREEALSVRRLTTTRKKKMSGIQTEAATVPL